MLRKENESFTCEAESEYFDSYGYILKPKGDLTEVSAWIDYKVVEHEEILGRGISVLLSMLKKFVE